jgi:hypothetical protein
MCSVLPEKIPLESLHGKCVFCRPEFIEIYPKITILNFNYILRRALEGLLLFREFEYLTIDI